MTIWSLVLKMNYPIGAEKGKKEEKRGRSWKQGGRKGLVMLEGDGRKGPGGIAGGLGWTLEPA